MQPVQGNPGGTTAAWDGLRQWVETETGMDLSGPREPRLRDAVHRVLSRQKPPADLERLLARPEGHGPFLEELTSELTVGESFFFRNEHHFEALRSQAFPSILPANAA